MQLFLGNEGWFQASVNVLKGLQLRTGKEKEKKMKRALSVIHYGPSDQGLSKNSISNPGHGCQA